MGFIVFDYLVSRVTTLKPRMERVPNPFKLLSMLTKKDWIFFGVAFMGWAWDAFDFFTVSLTVPELAKQFDKSNADITWGISLVLMLRFVGATIFGLASDAYGRKWPFVINCVMFIALELGTGFVQTYNQFLGVRSLFGIAMGGIYGNVAATALEDLPHECRGIISGIMQQGYSFGYLLATVFSRALVNTTSHGWRPLYWFGACPPIILIAIRLCLPETNAYQQRKALRETGGVAFSFVKEIKYSIVNHWLLFIYLILFMSGMNFASHASQDLYPTMLSNQYNFSPNRSTVTLVVANLGAIIGGAISGYLSQIFGRRIVMMFMCVAGGAVLYPYTFVTNNGILAAAFFEYFCVQGAWGVIPVHLNELAPPALRTFTVGTSYQLGNLASSASATIEAKLGEQFPLPPKGDVSRYQYGLVICIFMACIFTYNFILTFLGPEAYGRNFGIEDDDETAKAVGKSVMDIEHNSDIGEVDEKGQQVYRTEVL
ncbi:MFS general substrate transporter [Rhizodiscina lignyota]|uniref:MFS general substrate transporter n=1 Tax=Rhizodiscina lignyota TaxID=1504668 RepID=A0A9P4IBW9_9PEZI|nr:MFS general substrate transporter [Rhizodiscina lignyota]